MSRREVSKQPLIPDISLCSGLRTLVVVERWRVDGAGDGNAAYAVECFRAFYEPISTGWLLNDLSNLLRRYWLRCYLCELGECSR